MNIRRVSVSLCALLASSFPAYLATAETITFAGPSQQIPNQPASDVEGSFAYSTFGVGNLFRYVTEGNPAPSVGGRVNFGSGTLVVTRNDLAGSTFTFDQLDFAKFGPAINGQITVTGLLSDVVQDTDLFANDTSIWTTFPASDLAGVLIDELRIQLDAGFNNNFEAIDNLVLTIPEPATLALAALGGTLLPGLCWRRRQSSRPS